MADHMIQDVDDALRADKFHEFWRQYRMLFLSIAVALILGTALHGVWQHQREIKGGEMLARLSANEKLLVENKAVEAAQGFGAIAKDASGEFKDLALVWQARALIAADKKEEAVSALKAAVSDGHNLWTDIACLRLAGLDRDAAAPCLAASNSSPLASTRAEWSAANLWAKGDTAGASAAIEKLLANPKTGADSRQRLSQWLASIKSQAAQ